MLREWKRDALIAGAILAVAVALFLNQAEVSCLARSHLDNKSRYSGTNYATNEECDWWNSLAFWTFITSVVLTGSTIGLWMVTRRAANAAKEAADALPTVERAYVYPINLTPGVFSECIRIALMDTSEAGNVRAPVTAEITFQLKNFGKTPAILKEVSAGLGFWPVKIRFGITPSPDILGSGDVTIPPIGTEMDQGLTRNEANHILYLTGHLALVGHVLFEDIWGNEFRTEFHYGWNRESNQMRLYGLRTHRTNTYSEN